MSVHGTAAAVQMHHARNEQPCSLCAQYLEKLLGESFRPTIGDAGPTVDLVIRYPRAVYWRLEALADAQGKTPEQMVLEQSIVAVERPLVRIPRATVDQERQMRTLWTEGWSNRSIAKKSACP